MCTPHSTTRNSIVTAQCASNWITLRQRRCKMPSVVGQGEFVILLPSSNQQQQPQQFYIRIVVILIWCDLDDDAFLLLLLLRLAVPSFSRILFFYLMNIYWKWDHSFVKRRFSALHKKLFFPLIIIPSLSLSRVLYTLSEWNEGLQEDVGSSLFFHFGIVSVQLLSLLRFLEKHLIWIITYCTGGYIERLELQKPVSLSSHSFVIPLEGNQARFNIFFFMVNTAALFFAWSFFLLFLYIVIHTLRLKIYPQLI